MEVVVLKIGSCFAGIGGFELGLERAIPNSRTIWQVEQNEFCQSILKKHWKDAIIYDDVRTVGSHNLEKIDLLCAGFPCQDISIAGNQKGIYDSEKSSLYWELFRIIGELRPRVICLENVANVLSVGGSAVIASLTSIGYCCEWTVVRSGKDFGAPHNRKRWFCVAYSNLSRDKATAKISEFMEKRGSFENGIMSRSESVSALWNNKRASDWRGIGTQSAICRMDDGISTRMDRSEHVKRLHALGNAIVPQASQWVGEQILKSGLIDDLI